MGKKNKNKLSKTHTSNYNKKTKEDIDGWIPEVHRVDPHSKASNHQSLRCLFPYADEVRKVAKINEWTVQKFESSKHQTLLATNLRLQLLRLKECHPHQQCHFPLGDTLSS